MPLVRKPLLNELAKMLGPRILRKLYYSPISPELLKIYDRVNKIMTSWEYMKPKEGSRCSYLQPVSVSEQSSIMLMSRK